MVNLIGIGQIFPWGFGDSVKGLIDSKLSDGTLDSDYIRTSQIGGNQEEDNEFSFSNWGYDPSGKVTSDELDEHKIRMIRELLKQRDSWASQSLEVV